jgi:hypothetical protein
MKYRKGMVLLTGILVFGFNAMGQADSLGHKLDSLEKKYDTTKQVNVIESDAYNETTKITFRNYFKLLANDLKQQVTSPFRGTKQDWIRFGGLVAGTAALSFADRSIQEQALKWRDSSKTVRQISSYVTNSGGTSEMYTLIALGTYGFLFKNEKVQTTTLLASQAYITTAVIQTVLKNLTSRERPLYMDPKTGERRGRFHGPFYGSSNDFRSFPSGHATAAFAAATVYAMEYRKSVWVPVLSYTSASLISLSRLTENKHWATDILLGATLGYLCGRQVVNNYHRYAKIRNAEEKKKTGTLSFNLQYNYGTIQPGVVYRFK